MPDAENPMSRRSGDASPPRRAFARRAALLTCAGLVLSACDPGYPAAEARALLKAGRLEQAIELLRVELEARPGDPYLYKLYGSALLADGKPSLATWPLRRAAQDPELAVEAGLLLARALLSGGGESDAVRVAGEVLALEPQNADALALRAQARLRALDEEGALEDIGRLLELGHGTDPSDLSLLRAKLEAELRLERADAAEQTIGLLFARSAEGKDLPADYAARLCALEAVFTDEKGDVALAEERHERCADEYPTKYIVVQEAVNFFDAQRRFARGTEILERAAEEAPQDLQIRIQLASRLRDLERPDDAERVLRELAEQLDGPLAWTALADHFVELEDLAGAAGALERAVQAQTSRSLDAGGFEDVSDEGLFAYGDILVQIGDHERVQQLIQAIEEPSYVHFLEGRMRLERGDYAGAAEAYQAGLRLWPSNPGARYLAGQAAQQLGDFDRAISHYREALRAGASRTPAGLALARIQLAQGNVAGAYDALVYHLRSRPKESAALRLFADVAGQLDRDSEAAAARARLLKLPGQAGAAVADAARDRLRDESPQAALEVIEASGLDLSDPLHAEALRAWAEILSREGRDAEALARIDAALARHPEAAALHAVRGSALRRAGRGEEARAALRRALELDAAHVPALVALAELRAAAGDVDGALALYDRATAADPEDAAPAYAAAALQLERSEVRDATERLADLLRAHPWHGEAAYQLARLALERGETDDRALDYAARAVRFRYDPASFELLGRLLLARGEPEEALTVLRHGEELESSGPGIQYRMGQALEALGDAEAARAAYRSAVDSGSFAERADAERALARLAGDSTGDAPENR
jgi:tetratricopeptide (TPR) repeat protein